MFDRDSDVRGLCSGLIVSVPAFMVSAFFASTEYSMYPYFLVAYTTALYQITTAKERALGEESTASTNPRERKYGSKRRELVWSR